MNDTVIAAGITGLLSLIGVIVSNYAAAGRTAERIRVTQAVMEAKLEELTREVREHNHFARRIPVAEAQIAELQRRMNTERSQKYDQLESTHSQ